MSMRSRRRQHSAATPEVNLVPMMDVLMTVLVFFVIISMTLTGRQLLGVEVPQEVEGVEKTAPEETVEALIIGLDSNSNILIAEQSIELGQLTQQVRAYFQANPEGKLILKADRNLPYSEVAKFLTQLRDIGGNRVSLAVE
ncbi:ExbD/TolR family protein [Leptolyngbya sp. PCC 6406]|uniref:ExbD/TolR family protein n=1 Tax=Leptolyngbya sp. PCC 6406 TaxID=1173264 RepID=UPI0002ACBE89|nr:biopolymer transporter ExbD [Leptolyngbya sp. PCC 6406]